MMKIQPLVSVKLMLWNYSEMLYFLTQERSSRFWFAESSAEKANKNLQ